MRKPGRKPVSPSCCANNRRLKLLLASSSPRRSQLLRAAGYEIDIQAVDVDERPLPDESVEAMVARLACLKCQAASVQDRPVLAADTMVCLHGQALGKPADMKQARAMLQALSGQTHQVLTAVCVRLGDRMAARTVCTDVSFYALEAEEIDNYLQHHEVLDKAGGYAIQEGAASFIAAINGPLDNVIGLPVRVSRELLTAITTGWEKP